MHVPDECSPQRPLRAEPLEARLSSRSDSLPSSSPKPLLKNQRHLPDKQFKQNVKYFHFERLSEQVRPLLRVKVYRAAQAVPTPGAASPGAEPH